MHFWRWIREHFSSRQVFFAALVAIFLPVRTIFGLNIEKWAEKHKLDSVLAENEGTVMNIIAWLADLLISDLFLAFAVGGLIASFWGSAYRLITHIRAKPEIKAKEPEKVKWSDVPEEIRKLLSNMALLSQELYVTQNRSGGNRPPNLERMEMLLDKVRDGMVATYFDEGFRLLSTAYIVAAELEMEAHKLRLAIRMKGVDSAIPKNIVENRFMENAPIKFAEMLGIEVTPQLFVSTGSQSPQDTGSSKPQ